MHIDLIREADSDVGARLSARGAEGYLVALYDLDRIQASEYAKFQDEIIRSRPQPARWTRTSGPSSRTCRQSAKSRAWALGFFWTRDMVNA